MYATKLEFDISVFAFYIVVFTDTSYQANRRTISTGFSINGERLVQINPDRAEPEVFCVQKHEFRFFCARKFFCSFNASHYPFAQNLYQMFEDAIFVYRNGSCCASCI